MNEILQTQKGLVHLVNVDLSYDNPPVVLCTSLKKMKPTQVGDKTEAHNPQTSAPSLIVYDPLAQPLVAAVYLQGLLTANLALRYVCDIVKVECGMLPKDEEAGDLGIRVV